MEQRCPKSNHTYSLLQAGKGAGPGPALGRVSDQAPLMMDQGEEGDEEEAWLQLRPVEPLPSQCCGSGCSPCVFDMICVQLLVCPLVFSGSMLSSRCLCRDLGTTFLLHEVDL